MGKANEFFDAGIADFYRGDAARALREGKTPADARELIQNAILRTSADQQTVRTGFVDGLTDAERRNYSIAHALRYLTAESNEGIAGGLELEVSRHISKVTGKTPSPRGMFVPLQLNTRSGLDSKSGAAGAYSVATEIGDLIQFLRAQTKVIQLGATVLTNLDSNLAFPVQATATTASWVSQNPGTDVGESDSSFSQKTLSPTSCKPLPVTHVRCLHKPRSISKPGCAKIWE
jgi:HK97 family phage major capsid protein